jgi:hypothetical protein
VRDQQRGVHPMPSGPRLDLPARAYELQFHRGRLVRFVTAVRFIC